MKHKIVLCILAVSCVLLSACGDGGDGKAGFDAAPPKEDTATAAMIMESSDSEEPSVPEAAVVPKEPSQPQASEAPSQSDSEVLEIGEKMFLTQINDIYYNFDNYKDKTIVVEGMYTLFYSLDGSETAPVVYRMGPGCCGNDGWGGFLLKYDGAFPEENAWIRVTGTPELETTEDGFMNLYLKVDSLEVKEERGEEFVTQ